MIAEILLAASIINGAGVHIDSITRPDGTVECFDDDAPLRDVPCPAAKPSLPVCVGKTILIWVPTSHGTMEAHCGVVTD